MKKRYQIDKQRAAQQFRKQAGASDENIQLALPLPEVLALAQKGLMNLALAAFTKLAEEMMHWEVGQESENSIWRHFSQLRFFGPERTGDVL